MSNISPWLRFGLPLGNALLLVGVMDMVILIINMLKDTGVFLYYSLIDTDVNVSIDIPELVFLTALPLVKIIGTLGFLWIGTIFKGKILMLQAWIVSTAIFFVAIVVNLILESMKMPDYVPHLTYIMITFSITCLYQLIIAVACYNALRAGEVLQPIGKGCMYIWEYFLNDLHSAVKFFLISELVIDGYFIVTRQFLNPIFGVVLWGHEGDDTAPIVIEQIVLKGMRILLNIIGLAMVYKEKREAFRLWCIVSLVLILISTFLFVAITISWRGQDLISTLALFILFPGHLLYRCIILYFCLRYIRVNFNRMVL